MSALTLFWSFDLRARASYYEEQLEGVCPPANRRHCTDLRDECLSAAELLYFLSSGKWCIVINPVYRTVED